jgi:hypothetical protein
VSAYVNLQDLQEARRSEVPGEPVDFIKGTSLVAISEVANGTVLVGVVSVSLGVQPANTVEEWEVTNLGAVDVFIARDRMALLADFPIRPGETWRKVWKTSAQASAVNAISTVAAQDVRVLRTLRT